MAALFRFVLRFFLAFLGAKILLDLLGGATMSGLLWLSVFAVSSLYLFDLADWYLEGKLRRALSPKALGWRLARFLIGLNVVGEEKKRGGRGQGSKTPPPSPNPLGGD